MARKRFKPPDTQDNKELLKEQTSHETESEATEPKTGREISTNVIIEIPRWLFWSCTIFVAGAAIVIGSYNVYLKTLPRFNIMPEIMEDLGKDGIILFRQYDRDDDGVLDIEEFEPLAHRLLEMNGGTTEMLYDYEHALNETDSIVTVETIFIPLNVSTMTKDMTSVFSHGLDSLTGLKRWKVPNKPWFNFAVRHFAETFLPKDPVELTDIGQVYDFYKFIGGPQAEFGTPMSSNRYYPPKVHSTDVFIHRLLALFHSRPFVHMRFPPQGGAGCIRAYNKDYVDIVFRIHAEFQLNEPPFYPFWFTPAQFTGHVIISRDGTQLQYFKMFVPTDNKLNADMEWLNGPREAEEMEVDIGFIPQMEIRVSGSSHPAIMDDIDLREVFWNVSATNEIKWMEEIPVYKCRRKLEMHYYPFKEVEYFNITHAFTEARLSNKPVHHIALWGALDDQSC